MLLPSIIIKKAWETNKDYARVKSDQNMQKTLSTFNPCKSLGQIQLWDSAKSGPATVEDKPKVIEQSAVHQHGITGDEHAWGLLDDDLCLAEDNELRARVCSNNARCSRNTGVGRVDVGWADAHVVWNGEAAPSRAVGSGENRCLYRRAS